MVINGLPSGKREPSAINHSLFDAPAFSAYKAKQNRRFTTESNAKSAGSALLDPAYGLKGKTNHGNTSHSE
jgi:hypothetical protein